MFVLSVCVCISSWNKDERMRKNQWPNSRWTAGAWRQGLRQYMFFDEIIKMVLKSCFYAISSDFNDFTWFQSNFIYFWIFLNDFARYVYIMLNVNLTTLNYSCTILCFHVQNKATVPPVLPFLIISRRQATIPTEPSLSLSLSLSLTQLKSITPNISIKSKIPSSNFITTLPTPYAPLSLISRAPPLW